MSVLIHTPQRTADDLRFHLQAEKGEQLTPTDYLIRASAWALNSFTFTPAERKDFLEACGLKEVYTPQGGTKIVTGSTPGVEVN